MHFVTGRRRRTLCSCTAVWIDWRRIAIGAHSHHSCPFQYSRDRGCGFSGSEWRFGCHESTWDECIPLLITTRAFLYSLLPIRLWCLHWYFGWEYLSCGHLLTFPIFRSDTQWLSGFALSDFRWMWIQTDYVFTARRLNRLL